LLRKFVKSPYIKASIALVVSGSVLIMLFNVLNKTKFTKGIEIVNKTLMPVYIGVFIAFLLCPIYNKLVKVIYTKLKGTVRVAEGTCDEPVCMKLAGGRRMPAEDILQDGFITLFSKLDSYSGEGSFEGWARKIFVNTALMSLRKTDALKLSDDLEEAGNLSSDISTQIQNIGYKEIMKIVMKLPDGYRTVFNMFVVEGFSHKEIAQALNISEVTSRSQLQRARMILQEKIKKL